MMKGIILHGGHGTRLRPLTHTGPKQLLPIANKPMSQYALEDLREAGITDIAVIIGDTYPEKVKDFYGDGTNFGVNLTYIFQEKPKGISHAIGMCKDFIGKEKFVVYLGDNILRRGLTYYVKKFSTSKSEAMILLCEVDNPSRFGIAEIEKDKIKKIIEKPKNSNSNLAVIGIYFFTPKIFETIKKLKPSWRGELEVTDALQLLLEEGFSIDYDTVTGWWKDTGTAEDILHANRLLLDTIETAQQLTKENIIIGRNSFVSRDSHIVGPAIIDDNCTIGPSARIGPYVSVGKNTKLIHCHIENSIIMENCVISAKVEIINSIIASDSHITRNDKKNKCTLLLGEHSQIKL